jgi:hypothetical protein
MTNITHETILNDTFTDDTYNALTNVTAFEPGPIAAAVEAITGKPIEELDTPETSDIPVDLMGTDVEPVNFLGIKSLRSLPETEWLIENHIPKGLLTALFGQGASYKSFLALDWALSVAAGCPWHDLHVQQGPVIYVSGEGASGLYGRVEAWEAAHPTADTRLFAALPHAVRLLDKTEVRRFRKGLHLLSRKPSLIVFDTLQRTMAGLGDENSTQDMSRLVRVADDLREEFGASVLFVHHSGVDGERARGNSVLRNSVDAMWKLKRETLEGAPTNKVTLFCDKLKDGEEPAPRLLLAKPSLSSIVLTDSGETAFKPFARGQWDPSRPF